MPDTRTAVQPNSLLIRLREAEHRAVDPGDLAARWFDQTICIRLGGAAGLVREPDLLNHFRRSLGGALGPGASPRCAATHPPAPCPWEPPCALDVFFREQMRIGGDGLPKPFVMLADADGPDMIAGLRIFGFATEWIPALDHAFVDALRNRVPWRKRLRIAPPPVLERWTETCEGLSPGPPPPAVTLDWITPLDAEKIDAGAQAGSILTRLHRRLRGMARWHDAALPDLDTELLARWETMTDIGAMDAPKRLATRSGLQQKIFFADSVGGAMRLHGDLSPFWPLLSIGERCCIGRGATRGRGRYALR